MAYRSLSSLPAVFGSSSLCSASWLQRAVGPATSWAADSAWRSVATARSEDEAVALRTEGLPPPWEPPPHNPKSLKPKPAPSLPEILARIQQAPTAVEVHNAYRRKSGCLPSPIAAAMFTRLSQLLPVAQAAPAAPLPSQQPLPDAAASASSAAAASSYGGSAQARWERGQGALVAEIRRSWDVFLHLTPSRHLAALVRASCETGLLLQQATASAAPGGSGERSLVRRSLDVLLDASGRELVEAGPQAVLDVSYGLMLASHDDAGTWRTLGPLLREVEAQLRVGEAGGSAGQTAPGELAGKVLTWLEQKGLAA